MSSPGGGSGCSQVASKILDPSSPGSPGPSSSRPGTPLVNSANAVNSISPASSPQTAAAQLKNCLRSSQHTNQARTSMQLGEQKHFKSIYFYVLLLACHNDKSYSILFYSKPPFFIMEQFISQKKVYIQQRREHNSVVPLDFVKAAVLSLACQPRLRLLHPGGMM